MKQCLVLLALVILASTAGHAQTKKIFHASHSGSSRSFSVNSGGSNNFGLGHDEETKRKKDSTKVKKDTVGRVSDTATKKPLLPPKRKKTAKKSK